MILGIGSDLVRIDRIAKAMERFGERFGRRVFTPEELAYCRGRPDCLAKRFAAKEAFVKALGSGFRDGLWLRQIGVVNDDLGRPSLEVNGVAADYWARLGSPRIHLSLSDEGEYALAFLVLERSEAR